MPTTIDQGFRQLRSNLEITGLQGATVASRQQNVRAAVAAELSVAESFLTGSYMRNTMIAPLKDADIDIFVVLNPSYYEQSGQAALLDRVKRSLLQNYKTSNVGRNGRAVTIRFTDFVVDVVPAFYRRDGGFVIPDSRNSKWIETDPTKHVELWAETNKTHAGNFVPIVKMLKAWNNTHSQLMGSFHLETLARQVFTNVTITDFPSGVRFFFDKSRALIPYVLQDPAGFPGGVGHTTQTERNEIISRLDTALARAQAAEQYASALNIPAAFEKWRLVFEEYFPAYA